MRFNLYVANHRALDGIEDYISILRAVLVRHGHELLVTRVLAPHELTFVIDEFSSPFSNEELAAFKREWPESKLVFILTEFVERRSLVTSFNFFGGWLDAAAVAAMNVYLRVRRRDFAGPRLRDWLVAAGYIPGLAPYCLGLGFEKFLGRRSRLTRHLARLAYMTMRYLGFESMVAYADAVILSHPMIERGLRALGFSTPVLGTLYPELDMADIRRRLFVGKRLGIDVTGSITPYRKRWIQRINKDIFLSDSHGVFGRCRAVAFDRVDAGSPRGLPGRSAYSLHPPQSRGWRYASPTRIYRSLARDGAMPVLTKVFDQHPIEACCLVYRGPATLGDMWRYYRDRSRLVEFLEPRVADYMRIAIRRNDALVASIVALAGEPPGEPAHRELA